MCSAASAIPMATVSKSANRAADLGAKTAILSGYALQMTPEKSAWREIWMKPIRPTELIAAVERCLGKPRTPAAN
jgi:hypothetical protein